jgi:hypothetical protein
MSFQGSTTEAEGLFPVLRQPAAWTRRKLRATADVAGTHGHGAYLGRNTRPQ